MSALEGCQADAENSYSSLYTSTRGLVWCTITCNLTPKKLFERYMTFMFTTQEFDTGSDVFHTPQVISASFRRVWSQARIDPIDTSSEHAVFM
jgi:hypothetical protein